MMMKFSSKLTKYVDIVQSNIIFYYQRKATSFLFIYYLLLQIQVIGPIEPVVMLKAHKNIGGQICLENNHMGHLWFNK